MGQEGTVYDRQVRKRLQGSQKDILSVGLLWIVWTGNYGSRKILDSMDLVIRQKQPAHFSKVDPFVWRPFHGPKVEIKPVDIYVGLQDPSRKKAEAAPKDGLAPCHQKRQGGYIVIDIYSKLKYRQN